LYSPATATERAADRIIHEVYGEEATSELNSETSTSQDDQSRIIQENKNLFVSFMSSLIPVVHAQQPDINILSPDINKLKSLMKDRHQKLSKYYSGAVGMDNNGLITL